MININKKYNFHTHILPNDLNNGIKISELFNDPKEEFFNICNTYIKNTNYKFITNKLFINHLQTILLQKGSEYIIDIIYNIFKLFYNDLYQTIINNTDKNILEQINIFFKNYYNLNIKINNFKFIFSIINSSFKSNNKFNKSIFEYINSQIFYDIIINGVYYKDDNKYNLFEYFLNFINDEDILNINYLDKILNLLVLYNYYDKYKFKLTNINLYKLNLNNNITDKLVYVNEIIHIKINELYNNNKSTEEDLKNIKFIRKLITYIPIICNKSIFMNLYNKYLTERLQNTSLNIILEKEFFKSLDINNDIEIYNTMKNQLNNHIIKLSEKIEISII
jgi:hypothetical protein